MSTLFDNPYTGVELLISGAQLGADMAGLDAGLELGIPISGTAAAGYVQSVNKTNKVVNLELRDKYGLAEGEYTSRSYPDTPHYRDPYIPSYS